jgi:hypothetical protein
MGNSKVRSRRRDDKEIIDLSGESWLGHKPKSIRDIRKLKTDFFLAMRRRPSARNDATLSCGSRFFVRRIRSL